MSPLVLMLTGFVGFFAFAAVYYLILWLLWRREALLAVFGTECAIRAAMCVIFVALFTSESAEGAERAYRARYAVGSVMYFMSNWTVALFTGARNRWFLGTLSVALLAVFAWQVLVAPMNPRVTGVERSELGGWGPVAAPRTAPAGWGFLMFMIPLYVSNVFGFYCALLCARRSRVDGALITFATCVTLSATVGEGLRVWFAVPVPVVPGALAGGFWVPLLALLMARDRHYATDALAASDRRYRELADAIPQIVWIAGPDGAVTHLNVKASEYTGIGTGELRGRAWERVIHPDDLPRVLDTWAEVLRTGVPQVNEFRIRRADGAYRWHINRQVPSRDGTGAIARWYGTSTDVEDLKCAQAELADGRERLRTAVAAARLTPWDWDLRTGALVSLEFENQLGYTGAEVPREYARWIELLHPDDRDRVQGEIRGHLDGHRADFSVEFRARHKNGSYRWLNSVGAVLRDETGAPHRVLGCHIDVTERKEWEVRQGELVRELERRNAEMEQFTYTVSHDLKSPLVTIKGFADVLNQDLASGELGSAGGDLLRITTAADRMMSLLDDLLDLSRVGRVGGPLVPVVLSEVLGEALERVSGPARAAGVLLRVSGRVCGVVLGDRGRLVEVFQNVLENGVKYGGGGVVEVSGVVASGRVVVSVRDWGLGIEPRHRERIFGLFEKLDPKSPGTGVGLALVKKVVEFHGGRVWVESAGPGTGSTFVVDLPGHDTRTEHTL